MLFLKHDRYEDRDMLDGEMYAIIVLYRGMINDICVPLSDNSFATLCSGEDGAFVEYM